MNVLISVILLVGVVITVVLYVIYGRITQFGISKQYILKEVNSGRKTKIIGNAVEIEYKEYIIKIKKENSDWLYTIKKKLEENEKDFHKLGENDYIEVEDIKFQIITKKKMGYIILLPIEVIAVSSMLLLSQGLSLINFDEEKSQIDEDIEMNKDNVQKEIVESTENVPIDEVIEWDKEIQEDESIVEEMQSIVENDKIVDMQTIVLENDDLFQNSNVIDWTWEYEGNPNNMRRFLKNTPSELGISVSYYQEDIDWEKVKADGVDFAIIRLGRRGQETGEIKIDSKFKENMDGATANDIKVGVYFYSQAINKEEMDEEINEILNAVKEYELKYPIGIQLDCQENCRTYELSKEENQEEYINLIKYFCVRIKQNGYTPMIYGKMDWFQQFPDDIFDGYYKWIQSPNSEPKNIDNCVVWMYRENTLKVIDGIDVYVSVNVGVFDWEND